MVNCIACGGTLTYDITTGFLRCNSCSKCYAVEDAEIIGAEEEKVFDATVYACPKCGGEIVGVNNLAISNCSYCGEQVVLKSRMVKLEKPERIIPFQITKDMCKRMFKEKMSKAPCVPSAFRDEGNLEGFRAIYMPHWIYKGEQKGEVSFYVNDKPKKNQTEYYYHVKGGIDMTYEGMVHDASSSFPDSMSEQIAPYDMSKLRDFAPGYYAGFFADAADVASEVYEFEAEREMVKASKEKMIKMAYVEDKEVKVSNDAFKEVFHSEITSASLAMFPVWFMTYRTKDRVSYITMNGQNGRMAYDIPVSKPKFLLFSLIFGLFAALFLFVLKLNSPILCTLFMSFVGIFVVLRHRESIMLITKKAGSSSDFGENYAKVERAKRKNKEAYEAAKRAGMEDLYEDVYLTPEVNYQSREDYIRVKETIDRKRKERAGAVFTILILIVSAIMPILSELVMIDGGFMLRFIFVFIVIAGIWLGVENLIRLTETEETGKILKGGFAVFAVILCGVTLTIFPENLFYYTLVNVISLLMITITALDIVDKHNRLGTRKIPHFDYSKFN
ncbi:MAG: hypothetical protein K5656_11105 [Lachnospiraceae bacterium]|nr:hypothetical protein [Lachnospiraceae bacterium]